MAQETLYVHLVIVNKQKHNNGSEQSTARHSLGYRGRYEARDIRDIMAPGQPPPQQGETGHLWSDMSIIHSGD